MFLAYLFFLVWLGVTAFTSLPVFMYFNVWSMCKNTSLVEGANLCLDLRQFGESAVVKAGGQTGFTGVTFLCHTKSTGASMSLSDVLTGANFD